MTQALYAHMNNKTINIKKKTPKKLDRICCPQHRETNADTLK
jgi:hypothetical protein